jgi:hypothetical protein
MKVPVPQGDTLVKLIGYLSHLLNYCMYPSRFKCHYCQFSKMYFFAHFLAETFKMLPVICAITHRITCRLLQNPVPTKKFIPSDPLSDHSWLILKSKILKNHHFGFLDSNFECQKCFGFDLKNHFSKP